MKTIVMALVLAILCAALPVSAKNPAITVKPETISGTLTIVNVEEKTIFVKAENGITYDFKIGPATKVAAGDTKLKMEDLTGQIGKSIEVVFRPLKTGNAASTIEIK
jgi:hypothetical protein